MLTAQEIEQSILNLQKAISTTPVTGLLLVREDLQAEMALMAPVDTPLRNRLNRIGGNGKAHAWYFKVPRNLAISVKLQKGQYRGKAQMGTRNDYTPGLLAA